MVPYEFLCQQYCDISINRKKPWTISLDTTPPRQRLCLSCLLQFLQQHLAPVCQCGMNGGALPGLRRDKVFRISEELMDSKGRVQLRRNPGLCMKLKQQSQGVLQRQRRCPRLKGEFQGVWVWWSVCSGSFISLSGNWESGQSLQEGVFGKAEADTGILNKTGVCRYSILSKLPKGNVQIGT